MKPLHGQKVLILGATSLIAQEVSKLLADRQCPLFLVGRDAAKLCAIAADLKVRGAAKVGTATADLTDTALHDQIIEDAVHFLNGIDIALIAHGFLGVQKEANECWERTREILDVNFLSPASLASRLANLFETSGAGHLVVIGSVAGDRGKKGNYAYGAAKAGIEVFLEGIRHRLASTSGQVLLIKPGFVDTPMTAHLPKSPLFSSASTTARGIVAAIESGRSVVYLPRFWRYVMAAIRILPEPIFNKLSL